jgi:hypothetical protein
MRGAYPELKADAAEQLLSAGRGGGKDYLSHQDSIEQVGVGIQGGRVPE